MVRSFKSVLGLTMLAAVVASPAMAKGPWEIGGAANTSFSLATSTPLAWNLGVSGSVGYMLMSGIQGVLEPTFSLVGGAATTTTFGFNIGPRFNMSFSDKIGDDFFIYPAFTMTVAPGVLVGIKADIGKRFALTDSVCWAPRAGITLQLSPGILFGFNVVPVAFTFMP